jgi:hypothetical protein
MKNPFKKDHAPIRTGVGKVSITTHSKSVQVGDKTYKKGDALPPGVVITWR